ncbi:hypothetical protein C8R45DRAFT_892246 [Mycena sanguinolenta]|nr:hypothetical protein C8R45DRAFT_892246 [Mycena sanguinolenta]
MASHAYDVAEIPPPRAHKPKRTNRVLGDYTLSKTLGAGSMGKVKLATHNISGEKLAVKILPRARVNPAASSKEAAKEAGKEVRTLREAGLSLLLHHPYICGMREMIVHPNHYYMVFEYVNGGQLLDFIIAHGRLRESVARKFARQIASALDYCHRNNVVHRDLKIENILISQTGNIKIIDFGLSNLYDPSAHLNTFCGSLYFAAPELLNAKLYTGPEVDVWSFGVVLYTLVCGKVPFEDESMPALHAKIKRGLVEYPVWLSPECKHLLSRMLVVNPPRRALLSEIFVHPWMTRGFSGPPTTHLPQRTPLRPTDIDPQVVAHMAGFDFGSDVEEVTEKLHVILSGEEYARAVLAWEHRRNGHTADVLPPSPSVSIPTDNGLGPASASPPASPTEKQRRRFSGLDFYKRIFTTVPSSPSSPASPSATNPPVPSPRDPTGGFHPLVSMYFLAREKMERERVSGVGVFASSQVSLVASDNDTPQPQGQHSKEVTAVEPAMAPGGWHKQEETAVETETAVEIEDSAPKVKVNGKAGVIELAAKAEAVVEPVGVAPPVSVPESALENGRPPPPGLGNGVLDGGDKFTEEPEKMSNGHSSVNGTSTTPWPMEPSNVSIASPTPAAASAAATPSAVSAQEKPLPVPVPEKEKDTTVKVVIQDAKSEKPKEDEETEASKRGRRQRGQTFNGGTSLLRRFGSIFIGAGAGAREEKSKEREKSSTREEKSGTQRRRDASKRASISAGMALSLPKIQDESIEKEKDAPPPASAAAPAPTSPPSDEPAPSPAPTPAPAPTVSPPPPTVSSPPASPTPSTTTERTFGSLRRRATTILDPATRAARHERRSSTGGSFFTGINFGPATTGAGTVGRVRRSSMMGERDRERASATMGRAKRVFPEGDNDMREHPEELSDEGARDGHADAEEDRYDSQSEKESRPVFLKGLLSVATTSTKPPPVIKADIRRVLDRMQVRYWPNKSGFDCIHLPSINVSSLDAQPNELQSIPSTDTATPSQNGNGSITKRVSRLSFSVRRVRSQERSRELPFGTGVGKSRERPASTLVMPQQPNDHQPLVVPDAPGTPTGETAPPPSSFKRPSTVSVNSKLRSVSVELGLASPMSTYDADPLASGEMDRVTFEHMAHNALGVRFEINIVKVPWLPLHGIQFRRAGGDGWQYHMLARRVLTELKL